MTKKLDQRVLVNLDAEMLAQLEQHRLALESKSGLRVSRSNVAVSLLRSALATNKAPTSAT